MLRNTVVAPRDKIEIAERFQDLYATNDVSFPGIFTFPGWIWRIDKFGKLNWWIYGCCIGLDEKMTKSAFDMGSLFTVDYSGTLLIYFGNIYNIWYE